MALWDISTAPAFAKIVDGQVVRLAVEIPPFDGETEGLQELSLADRVKAGWYQVDAEAPTITNHMPGDPPAIYELLGVDNNTGIARLSMEQPAPKGDRSKLIIRMTRDNLLAKSDRTQFADFQEKMTADQKKAWKDYRQALRDAPQTGIIPTAPGEL